MASPLRLEIPGCLYHVTSRADTVRAVWRHRDMLLSYQARHHPRHRRIKVHEAEVAAALQGNWRGEHLFTLKIDTRVNDEVTNR